MITSRTASFRIWVLRWGCSRPYLWCSGCLLWDLLFGGVPCESFGFMASPTHQKICFASMGCPISICISGQCALYKILPSSTYSHNTWMCLGTGESSPYMHRHHAPNPTATSPTTSTSSCEMVLYSDLANMIM